MLFWFKIVTEIFRTRFLNQTHFCGLRTAVHQLRKLFESLSLLRGWFPLDRNGFVESCDSTGSWLIVERLITVK